MENSHNVHGRQRRFSWFLAVALLGIAGVVWLSLRACLIGSSSSPPADLATDSTRSHTDGPDPQTLLQSAPPPQLETTEESSTDGGSCLVRGMVIDVDNHPVVGAEILKLVGGMVESSRIGRWDPSWQETGESSNSNGAFAFSVNGICPPKLAATTNENATWGECGFDRKAKPPLECVLVLEDAWPLQGLVLDEAGSPVSGADVSAMQQWNMDQLRSEVDPRVDVPFNHLVVDSESMWSRHVVTDANGRFRINRVPEDDWAVVVEKAGYERGFGRLLADDLLEGEELRVALHPMECWTIRVLDIHGEPVEDSEVRVAPIAGRPTSPIHEGETDPTGSARICEVSSTNAQVSVTPQWHSRQHLSNVYGEDPLVISVEERGCLTGTIHCPNIGGQRIYSCRVASKTCVASDGSACRYRGYVPCENVETQFEIKHVTEGEMDIEIHCKDQMEQRHVIARSGEATDIGSMVFNITWPQSGD